MKKNTFRILPLPLVSKASAWGKGAWIRGLIMVLMLACLSCSKVQDRLPFHKEAESAQPPVPVHVLTIGSATDATTRTYVGELKAASETDLFFPAGGQLTALRVKSGETVRKGQLLAEVDHTQAAGVHDAAVAVLRQAQDAYDRVRALHDKGLVADVKWVEMQTTLEKARQSEIVARRNLSECRLTAPADGIVNVAELQVGQQLLPGQRVLTLLNISALEAEFSVPEQDIVSITIGQEASIDISASDTVLDAVISEKSLSANAIAHTYTVRASLLTKALPGLLPGMVCKVRMAGATSENGIVLPGACVQTTPEGPAVWVIIDGKAERRIIRSDKYVKDGILVSSGLHAGDQVVTSGYQKLYNGALVTIE